MLDIKQFYNQFIAPVVGETPYGSVKDETSSGAGDGSTVLAGMITNMAYAMYQVLTKAGETPSNVIEDLKSSTPNSQQFIVSLVKTFLDRSEFTAKGDLVLGSGSATIGGETVILTIGADGTVATADSSQASGVKWKTASGGGGSSMQAIYNAVKEYKETGNNNLIDDTIDFLTNNTSENAEIIRALVPAVYDKDASGGANLKIPLWFGTSDQLEVIDDLDAIPANLTADLNGGSGSFGALALDSSSQSEGSACVSVTFTAADAWAGFNFDFSADPKSIDDIGYIAALRAQTLVDFDYVRIIASDGAGTPETAYIQCSISEFLIDTWHYGCMFNPKKATYSSPDFDKNDVQTLQFLFHVTSSGSPYTGNIKIDFLCSVGVDDFLAIDSSGDYEPRAITIHDTGNDDKAVMWIIDYENGLYSICDFFTDNLATALPYSFPNSKTTADVQTTNVQRRDGIADNGALPITSGESEVYWQQSVYPGSGKVISEIQSAESTSSAPYDIVNIVKGSNQIIIPSDTDISADYPNDTEILLTRLQNGRSTEMLGGDPDDAIKITGASYDAPTEKLTLTVDNTTLLASVPDNSFTEWSLIRIDIWGWVKDKATGVVNRATVTGIKITDNKTTFFEDTFNRASSATVGSNWGESNDGAGVSPSIVSDSKLQLMTNSAGTSWVYRNSEAYTLDSLDKPFKETIRVTPYATGSTTATGWFYINYGSVSTNGHLGSGIQVRIELISAGNYRLKILEATTTKQDIVVSLATDSVYLLDIELTRTLAKARIYLTSSEAPEWQAVYEKGSDLTLAGAYYQTGIRSQSGIWIAHIDNLDLFYGDDKINLLSKISTINSEIVKRLENTTQESALNESVALPISN